MSKFMSLKVWQRSKDLAVYIYKITGKGKFSKDFGLCDQIRRAAVSMPSNIAEGAGRQSAPLRVARRHHRGRRQEGVAQR